MPPSELSSAVSTLTESVEGLRDEVGRNSEVNAQLVVRCGQLEKTSDELHRYLFTGNGQPALTVQIASLRTLVDTLSNEIQKFANTRVSKHQLVNTEHIIGMRIGAIEKEIGEARKDHDDLEDKQDETQARSSATKLQIWICVVGGAAGILAALISAAGSLLAK